MDADRGVDTRGRKRAYAAMQADDLIGPEAHRAVRLGDRT